MSVTIKDVSKDAKVSIKTVSRVINNEINVSVDTKQKVLQSISKLGSIT
jgi:LacI family transcriptional regulator